MARILVVDDDQAVLEMTAVILRKSGHEVATAINGAVAYPLWCRFRHDLIISDCEMPEIGGIELARMVYAQDPNLPIILTSGRHCPSAWTGLFLTKPFHMNSLINLVNRVLGGRSHTPPRTSTPPPAAPAPA